MDTDKIKYLFIKFKNRLLSFRILIWKYFNVERMAMREYKPFADARAMKSRLQKILGVYNSNVLSGISSSDRSVIIASAEQALRHEFDLLGSGPVVLEPINWHTDFKSGAHWDKRWYREIKRKEGSDIKVPWELSRCQHLLWLGEAFLLTKDNKYAQEIIDEINWWIDDNPLMFTVNWTCAMDVAFRAINWMYALNMISGFEGYNDDFASKVAKSLWVHGFFIIMNLERQIPYSNNHYASDLVGLLYVGAFFNDSHKGKKWFEFALKEYVSEIHNQVLPSGVHYERSVSYHRMMTEMLSYPVYMLKRINVSLPAELLVIIGKMYEYIAIYTKPNNLAPLIADNDDGRFVPFLKRDFRNHAYLNDSKSIENRFVSVGISPLFCSTHITTALYLDAGVAIIRKGQNYLYINNGGYSKRPTDNQVLIGTHTHNDLLSFELSLNGNDIIIDPGTYLYTSSPIDRNAFRSTAKHNTVMVDNEEQNGFVQTFLVSRNIKKGVLMASEKGYVGDYITIKGGLRHQRCFLLEKNGLILIDNLNKGGGEHEANFYYHFAYGIDVSIIEQEVIVTINGQDYRISFSEKPEKIFIIDDALSPSYGIKVSSKSLVVSYIFNESIEIETKIEIKQ